MLIATSDTANVCAVTKAKDNAAEPPVTQRKNELSRTVVEGRRTDDGDQCKLVLIQEIGGTWALYPHGVKRFGVRLPRAEAVTVAQVILAGAQ